MKYKKIIVITIIVLIFSLMGCKNNPSSSKISPNKSTIANPNKIIVYNGGKSKNIDKNHELFSKVVSITNKRINFKEISLLDDKVDNKTINSKKKVVMAVEFIYNEEQNMYLSKDNKNIKFTKLFFELSNPLSSIKPGGIENTSFQYGDEKNYKGSSMGNIKEAEELVNLLKDIKMD